MDTREASNYFRGFYARRLLRIFPLYYAVLTAVILFGVWFKDPEVSAVLPLPGDRWLYFTYLTNWLGLWKAHWGPDYANFLAHFWSLALEEQFYFVWPLMVWLIPTRLLARVAAALVVVAFVVRWIWVLHSGEQIAISLATVCHMDSLFVGAIGACIFRSSGAMQRARPRLPGIAILSLGSFVIAYSLMLFNLRETALLTFPATDTRELERATMRFAQLGGYSLLAVGFGALVLMAADSAEQRTWFSRVLQMRWLRLTGRYSYGIYVFHVPLLGATSLFVQARVEEALGFSFWTGIALVMGLAAVTFGISAASYELFESRVLRLKRHFEPAYESGEDVLVGQRNAAAVGEG